MYEDVRARCAKAIGRWKELVGDSNVVQERSYLENAEFATFETKRVILAIIRPENVREVQAALRIANRFGVPVYPISTGTNWGYGSGVPVQDNSVVMDLGRMNRIVEVNEQLAFATVEPGVTQRQLFEHLRASGSRLFLSMTGASPDSSLIGNVVERGLAEGPGGDRASTVCAFEVVLPTGECIRTGFGQFPRSRSTGVNRWGVGPAWDGLFPQSNLGIVTRITIWLTPRASHLSTFRFVTNDNDRLHGLVDGVRRLRLAGVIRESFVIANDLRLVSCLQQCPSDDTGWRFVSGGDRLALRQKWNVGLWNGEGFIHAVSQLHQEALQTAIADELGNLVDVMEFSRSCDSAPDSSSQHHPGLHRVSPGVPTSQFLTMAYWRNSAVRPRKDLDPDRDRCGLLWCCPSVPADGSCVREALAIIEDASRDHSFESNIGINIVTERSLVITAALLWDLQIAEDGHRAARCHQTMAARLSRSGYYPYRLNIDSMSSLPAPSYGRGKIHRTIKEALDPNDILAPGRYDFRGSW